MNKLFKNGDYVLLEDCKTFDEKYGLFAGFTMWAVARKMEGGEPKKNYMVVTDGDTKISNSTGAIGVWFDHVSDKTKLSVEDVLYRSENGLTIDELREIHGAFEEGKQYECVVRTAKIFTKGNIYKANGIGMADNYGYSSIGNTAKFKPVTAKPKWVPSVGDNIMYIGKSIEHVPPNTEAVIRLIGDQNEVVIYTGNNIGGGLSVCMMDDLKTIDKKRERVIKKLTDFIDSKLPDNTGSFDIAGILYDAGMLTEGQE